MAEVRIKADTTDMQRGLRATTQQAQKLTRTLTKTKAPLLHSGETRKSVQANNQYNRGIRETANRVQQVDRATKGLLMTQRQQVRIQRQILNQQQQMVQKSQRQKEKGKRGGSSFGQRSFKAGVGGAAMALGFLGANATRGLQTLIQNQAAQASAAAVTGQRRALDLGTFSNRLAFTTAQGYQARTQMTRAVGGRDRFGLATMSALALQRGRGLDMGTIAGLQSAARQAGGMPTTRTGQAPYRLNQALVKAVEMGGFGRALTQEFASSVTGVLRTIQFQALRSQPRVLMGQQSVLARGMGFQRAPQRTAQLMQSLNQAITAPGGGGAGQALVLRAMGFGQGASLFESQRRAQRGIADPRNISRLVGQIRQEYQGRQNQTRALHAVTGGRVSFDVGMRLFQMRQGQLTPQAVQQTMSKARQPSMTREARKVAGMMGFQRREIAKDEARARLRASLDPLFMKAFRAEMVLLETSTKQINKTIKEWNNQLAFGNQIYKEGIGLFKKIFANTPAGMLHRLVFGGRKK